MVEGVFALYRHCPKCRLNFFPEPGFYLGAIAISYVVTAALTIPPVVLLKYFGAENWMIVAFPFLEFILVGSFLFFYSRIIWLHLQFHALKRLNSEKT